LNGAASRLDGDPSPLAEHLKHDETPKGNLGQDAGGSSHEGILPRTE